MVLGLFGDVFLMLSGGGRNVHVDNATLVKYCIFHRAPPPRIRFLPYRRILESLQHFFEKVKKKHENRSEHERPCPTPLWRAFGSMLVSFWSPFGSQNRPKGSFEGVENLVEVKETKTRKKLMNQPKLKF